MAMPQHPGERGHTRPRAIRLVTQAVFLLVALAFFYMFMVLFSPSIGSILYPDEIHGFNVFASDGWLKGIHTYWVLHMGRYAAITWFGAPFVVSDFFNLSPWHVVVVARIFGFLFSIFCAGFLVREVFGSRLIGTNIAAGTILLAASFSHVGVVTTYWLLNQATYLLSFSFLCLLLALFWRIATREPRRGSTFLVFVFFFFIGLHEVNLVTGGLMLGVYAITLFWAEISKYPNLTPFDSLLTFAGSIWKFLARQSMVRIGKLDQPWRFGIDHLRRPQHSIFTLHLGRFVVKIRVWCRSGAERHYALILTLALAYLISAVVQLTSPSIEIRNNVWPPQYPWPDSISLGLKAGFLPLYELLLGMRGSLLPIFLGGFAWGLWWYRGRPIGRFTGLLLLTPLILAVVNSLVTAILSARTGVLVGPAFYSELRVIAYVDQTDRLFLTRQQLFSYQFYAIGLALLGLFLSQFFGWKLIRHLGGAASIVLTLALTAWLAYTIVSSDAFTESKNYGSLARLNQMTDRYGALQRGAAFDGQYYVEELPRHPRAWPGPEPGTYQHETQLGRMFGIPGQVQFVPCSLAGATSECATGPMAEQIFESSRHPLADIWPMGFRGTRHVDKDTVVFTEIGKDGEHFLQTRLFEKSGRTIVDVTLEIDVADYQAERDILIYLITGDGTAFVQYDLRQHTIARNTDIGARALDGTIEETDGAVQIWAYFFIDGEADKFKVRIQGVDGRTTSYPGKDGLGFRVLDTRIRTLSTGEDARALMTRLRADP